VSCYLAFYFAIFIGLSRVAVHGLHITPVVAAPVVWAGLEWARAHFLGGFAMAAVSHTQYRWPALLQICDIFGEFGVSFLIVLVGACLACMIPLAAQRRACWHAIPLAGALAATFAYGHWRGGEQTTRPGPQVALVQGSIDIEMKYDPKLGQHIFDEYYGLSREAVDAHPDLQLIVWPETMFREPWFTFDKDYQPPPTARWTPQQVEARSRLAVESTVARLDVPCLIGIDAIHHTSGGIENFNSALFTDRAGDVLARYDKCHLVPFGEYVPFADMFPWLYRLTPLPFGSRPGTEPLAIDVGGARLAINICYENTLGQFIAGQVNQLRAAGQEPDVLVNLTNDGWFWGSAELDLHLACAVFRAVECRKPFLIAANTGFSAWIDSDGRIVAQGPRRATDVIVATPAIDPRGSWFLDHGDKPAGACFLAVGALALVGLRQRRRARQSPSHQVVST
jgi:apolipoprotein N-acyltransferase